MYQNQLIFLIYPPASKQSLIEGIERLNNIPFNQLIAVVTTALIKFDEWMNG